MIYRSIPWFLIPYLERVEGERNRAYQDSRGRWTCGVGSTSGVGPTTAWTQDEIDQHLYADLEEAQARLYMAIGSAAVAKLSDCQYAALLSFVFNEGEVSTWTIWADIRQGNLADVPAQMARFVYSNGEKVEGLVNRRAQDVALWNGLDPVLKLQAHVQ